MAIQSSPALAVARTTATREDEKNDARLPALKGAADNLKGPFTSAAEVGTEEGEGPMPALKAATDNRTQVWKVKRFTAAARAVAWTSCPQLDC